MWSRSWRLRAGDKTSRKAFTERAAGSRESQRCVLRVDAEYSMRETVKLRAHGDAAWSLGSEDLPTRPHTHTDITTLL
jgi:hypothetical protein